MSQYKPVLQCFSIKAVMRLQSCHTKESLNAKRSVGMHRNRRKIRSATYVVHSKRSSNKCEKSLPIQLGSQRGRRSKRLSGVLT